MSIIVGTGVIIVQNGRLLVSRRLAACKTGVGALSVPGGTVEAGETIRDAVIRESKEETGMDVVPMRFTPASYVFHVQEHFGPDFHSLTHYVRGIIKRPAVDKPQNTEPHKHSPWRWVTLSELAGEMTSKDWVAYDALVHHRKFLNLL
jgi:ADP-ribose pyrophosphatase YjhB (NUDIX family)